ncbi:MAG: heparinase II/III family protein [Acidobacteria bacterium]|nr:heparinase II/III family protein [Acidobacteriota bacterium]
MLTYTPFVLGLNILMMLAAIPPVPAEHPRLYLRARQAAELERRTEHPVLAPVWNSLLEAAKKNPQIRAETNALRYLMTRDEELGRRTVAETLQLLEQAHYPAGMQDVTRPIGRMMVTGAVVYDWCYRLLTAAQKQACIAQLVRLARELECGYPPREIGSVTGHGSEWMIMRDMLSAGVAIHDEDPEMYRLAAERFFARLLPARNFWYPGHAFHQGSAYAETRVSSELYPLFIFDRLGAGNVYHPAQQFVPYQWIYMRRPDGQLLRSGDGQSKAPKLRSLLNASYYGDGYVLGDYLRDPGIDPMSQLFEFLWRDPDLKPLPVEDLPLSRYFGFPYGWMVARTGWGQDAVIAEMKVNVYNFGNHQHHDAGAFQIYHQGPLAIDSGLYEGTGGAYGSPHHVNYYKRTIAHNSLLIHDPEEKFLRSTGVEYRNDGGQRLPNGWREPATIETLVERDYKTGTVLGQGFGPDARRPMYTYLKGDLTEAYSKKVKEVQRSFVFLNLGGAVPAALVVFDRVVAANPSFRKYWLLHSMEEPAIQGNTARVSLSQRGWTGRMTGTVLLPEAANAEIAKVGGPGKEFWVFGENFPNQPRRGPESEYEIGAWRVELSPRQAAETDHFLNVLQVTDGSGQALPVERLEAGGCAGARVSDRVVWFRRDGHRSDRPFSFELGGAGSLRVLATDLAEGVWQVWRDGRIVLPAVSVAADAGTLYFEGPAGKYQLRR